LTVGGGSRRTVTVLFADMVESTALGERLDPEAFRAIQVRYFAALREVVERHGGIVEKYIGDAVMAVFGVPAAHEDDALRAVRAASELGASLTSLGEDLQRRRGVHLDLRVGVHTGPVVVTDGDGAGTLVTGDTVNTAARLQQAAAPGEILLGGDTFDLVRDAVEVEALESRALKGRSAEVRSYRLKAVTGEEGRVRRANAPLVGRGSEIAVLEAQFRESVNERVPRLVTVLGAAGVGKSRLVREFAASVGSRAAVIRGRCLSYGDGITYWPIVEILRGAAGLLETDDAETSRGRLSELVAGTPGAARLATVLAAIVGASDALVVGDDVSWAVRRAFETLARRGPLIVIVEDIHWAEPTLLDLLESVVDWTSDAPFLILCLARPEILDERPTWGSGGRASNVALDPLGSLVAEDLLKVLPGGGAIPTALRGRILAAAEGNPLYLEELVAKLIDDGGLQDGEVGWTWTGDADALQIPATVHALVATRIDGLAPIERHVAERASVVGRVFERGAVAALGPSGGAGSVGAPLLSLVRKQLINPDGSGIDGDDAFRFRHIVIRDVAYDRMPKAERAELHERFATWLESVLGDRAPEYVEIVAHHLAEAVDYRIELDTLRGPDAAALVNRAADLLAAAGERAERLHAYAQAARLFDRAASLSGALETGVPRDSGATVDLKRRAADAHALAGDIGTASERVRGLLKAADEADPTLRGMLLERLAEFAWDLGDEAGTFAAIEEATRLIPADPPSRERAQVLAGHARFLMISRRYEESMAMSRAALDVADKVDSPVIRVSALVTLGTCLGSIDRENEGIALLEEGRDLAVAIGDGPGFLRASNNLGVTIRDRDRSDQALIKAIDQLPDLGLERSSSGILLRVNLANGLLHSGRLDEGARVVDRALILEPTGDDGIDALLRRAYVEILRGHLPEADAVLSAARDRASGGAQRSTLGDLAWTEAFAALFERRFDDVRERIREAMTQYNPNPVDPPIEQEWLELLVVIEEAITARADGDEAGEREAIDAARRSVSRMREMAADAGEMMGWIHRHSLPMLEPELSRAEGRPNPVAWQAAADELRADRFLWDEAYALYRRAEALLDVGAPPGDVAEGIETATTAAEAIGADGIVKWAAELRARPGR
jgi:class 3 adenylate cyclase/tetratricopeptide (TPR) repeat protein